MSWRPEPDPSEIAPPDAGDTSEVEALVEPHQRDLGGGFFVRRVLPALKHRTVGPYVFFDHFGPTLFAPGQGLDVRPHPHINLATVTYLFDGEIVHRDSLGSLQTISPGAINWMTAGRGIVHSERTGPALRAAGSTVHGIQLWVGLPREHEETAPEFHHHPADSLPTGGDGASSGVRIRVLVGEAFGLRSPVKIFSRLHYVDVDMDAGASLELPADAGERAAYLVDGTVLVGGRPFSRWQMPLFRAGRAITLRAPEPCRLVLLGGDPFPEPRHIWWNYVSSRAERIEEAKHDWLDRRGAPDGPFPLVPGDETEFIPLPSR
jgi:redox-sensitive bicupin YhaK (pirin superfamily)